MFSVSEETNRRNLSTSAVEAETKHIKGEVLEKIPVIGMAYRDRLPQKLRFFYNPYVEVTARHRKKTVEHFINLIVPKQGKHKTI